MITIKSALADGRERLQGSPSAALDARIVLCHVLHCQDAHLFTWPEQQLNAEQCERYDQLLERRVAGEPVAYLVGEREFYGRNFSVNAATLIPRPDTEALIDAALTLDRSRVLRVVDAGTGSGAVGVTLALECPLWQVTVMDRSQAALSVAAANARSLGAKVYSFCGDWLAAIRAPVDLVISNPPYIDDQDPHLNQGDVRYEPRSALVADKRGLADIETLVVQAGECLTPGGWLMVEHGYQQAEAVATLFIRGGFERVSCQEDMAGHPRVTVGQWRAVC